MAHKTFISYKYSDARNVRDRIIHALGDDARFYNGEDGLSDDLTDFKAETIKQHLKDMIYDTSVTILVVSPEMNESKWIPWEIEYSLKEIKRADKTSHANGMIAVIKKVNGTYEWILKDYNTYKIDNSKLPKIIRPYISKCLITLNNNEKDESYISAIAEEDFLQNPTVYIESAYKKSKNKFIYDLFLNINQ